MGGSHTHKALPVVPIDRQKRLQSIFLEDYKIRYTNYNIV